MKTTEWTLKFQHHEPKDWEVPTLTQQLFLRRLMMHYTAPNYSEGDIIISLWKTGKIELNDSWEVWRHPIFVYRNFCKTAGMSEDCWNEPYNDDDWRGIV